MPSANPVDRCVAGRSVLVVFDWAFDTAGSFGCQSPQGETFFKFIAQLPLTWDEPKVLDAEIGKFITMGRRSGDQWFVASLADEQGRETSVALDFLEDGVSYDVTLYEDALDARYEYFGPGTKKEAAENRAEDEAAQNEA